MIPARCRNLRPLNGGRSLRHSDFTERHARNAYTHTAKPSAPFRHRDILDILGVLGDEPVAR